MSHWLHYADLQVAPLRRSRSTEARKFLPHNMLIRFQDVQKRFGVFLKHFYTLYESLEDVLNSYFGVTNASSIFLEQHFLGLVQGLEALHRRTATVDVVPSTSHQKRISAILASCPDRYRGWLTGKLSYSHEPRLRNRLKELFSPFKQVFWRTGEENCRFISRTVEIRNYLTHYSKGRKPKRTQFKELSNHCRLLRGLFEVFMLRHLDFTDEEIRRCIESNQGLRRLLAHEG